MSLVNKQISKQVNDTHQIGLRRRDILTLAGVGTLGLSIGMPTSVLGQSTYKAERYLTIHGYCDERFASVRDEFERNFIVRGDVGASFAATLEGEYVVDLWAGHHDEAKTIPWEQDTIARIFSGTKTMTALCALVLFDRGELSFDDRVTKYWPEYGQNGKQTTEIRHFMGHTAGVPGFGEKLTLEQLADWDYVISVLERQAPWFPPGEKCTYHTLTQGFLVGEIVRRISGQSLGTFFRENVAKPLGADFHIGLDPTQYARVAPMLADPEWVAKTSEWNEEDLPEWMRGHEMGAPDVMPPVTNSDVWRRAEIPAGNGHGNASSLVRAQTAIANDGSAFGVNLISSATVEQIFREQGTLIGSEVKHGMGYGLSGAEHLPQDAKVCFWGGFGGSTMMLDLTNRACFSYVMNRMHTGFVGDMRGASLTSAFYEGLQQG
jgi:CubicO group peptidase (beta-lactamase class C family)